MKSLKYFPLLTLLAISLIFLPCPVQCQSGELHMQKVTENLYMISGGIGANAAFLVTDVGVLVIDAKYFPYQGEQIVAQIRQVTDKPYAILFILITMETTPRERRLFPRQL